MKRSITIHKRLLCGTAGLLLASIAAAQAQSIVSLPDAAGTAGSDSTLDATGDSPSITVFGGSYPAAQGTAQPAPPIRRQRTALILRGAEPGEEVRLRPASGFVSEAMEGPAR